MNIPECNRMDTINIHHTSVKINRFGCMERESCDPVIAGYV